MASLKQLASQTVIYGMGHVLPKVLNYVLVAVYLTHKFEDPREFGIFTELYAYVAVLISIMVFRMDTAYFRFGSITKDANDRLRVFGNTFLPMILLVAIFVSTLCFFDDQIASLLKHSGQGHYVRWFAFILGFDAITTLIYSKFRLDNQPKRFLFYRIINVLIHVSLLLFFIEFLPSFNPQAKESLDNITSISKDLDYVFLANLIASFTVFVLMLPELFRVKFNFDWVLIKKVLKYSWPLVVVSVAGNINQAVAVPLQKWWLSGNLDDNEYWMGIYGGISKIAILLSLFTTAYNYAAEPYFFNNAKGDKKEIYGKAALAYTLFGSLVVLGTFFYIDQIILMLGKSYREGLFVVPILLLAYLMLGLYYNVSIWYKLSDKTIVASKISLVGVAVTLTISLIFLPIIGMVASAWAALACFTVMLYMCYNLGQKYYPIEYPVKKILTIVFITAFLLGLSYLLRGVIDSLWIRFGINSFILVAFVLYIWKTYLPALLKSGEI